MIWLKHTKYYKTQLITVYKAIAPNQNSDIQCRSRCDDRGDELVVFAREVQGLFHNYSIYIYRQSKTRKKTLQNLSVSLTKH